MKSPSRFGRQPRIIHARSAKKEARIGEEPKATITILIYSDRTLLWIPTGCALRWAQRDWGIRISPGNSHSRDVPSLLAIPDAPIPGYGRFAHGLRWGFHPQTPDKGLRPLTSCSLRAVSSFLISFLSPLRTKAAGNCQRLFFPFYRFSPLLSITVLYQRRLSFTMRSCVT